MGTAYRVAKGLLAVVGWTGLGVGLWFAVAPDETRRKEMAKDHPGSSPEQRTERQQRNALVMAVIKEAAETDENVAKKQWPWVK
ncbi:ubiquinol-cytochrome-c reductase complex assembly factor 3 [Anolis carolinensis]|uniref:ubiquinol-cytochrome-c reductase complex assembly factor 3 n=1 Tax=Anolis carolinensis TaxID=28377 RepID=UPI000462ABBB|nr:PREDICTED: ubiquinol-cytochrome-c reductase complex assembly factor 3 [Anolis carolinensis]|eukprot:XP_008122485.1 PREDICTED: ubiquinol-cytochrome-c reductase complex assembly factor 3 [Anolis carolinensis]